MRVWHRFLSMFLALTVAASVIVIMPEERAEAAAGLTPFQQAVQSITSEAKGKYRNGLNSYFGWSIPAVSWCGYYADCVLRTALARCGYSNYRDYYSSDEMPGATRIARNESNDGRWQAYYSWNSWTFSGRSGVATDNISSYEPQVGDIVTVNTDSNADPDHTAVICKVYGDNSFQTSDGNTGYSAFRKAHGYEGGIDDMYVRTYDYSRSGSSSAFKGGCGTVVCIVRPYDPTAGRTSHSISELGSPWYPSDDFYAYIVKRDGWVHLESAGNDGADHNVTLARGSNNDNYSGQLWRFEKQSNGTYVIYNQWDGYVLDAYNLGKTNGTNVTTYGVYNGGGNQQWYLYNTSGGVVIKPAYCDLVLDVNGGSSARGTNVQLWEYNATSAQLFSVYIVARRYTAPDHYAYLINKAPWMHLEAAESGNVRIAANGNDSRDPKQIWQMDLQSDKSYIIRNAYDGKVLDCSNGNNTRGTNVAAYGSNGSSNQRFCLYSIESEYKGKAGGFIIRPKYSDHLVLDVTGGTAAKGTNIELWNFNFTDAQVFAAYALTNDGVNYSKPSNPAAPVLTAPASYTVNEEQKISWTGSALRSDKFDSRLYRIEVTDSSGKVFYSDAGNVTSSGIWFNTEGTYRLRVLAVNTKYRDCCSASNTVVCTVSKPVTDLTIDSIKYQTYTGSPITPDITVRAGGVILSKNIHYTVTYKNNINAGTATVTITGKGLYSGSTATATYKINPGQISETSIPEIRMQKYTGHAIEPDVTVKDGNNTLICNTDYTLKYSNNINAGTAVVTVTGKGNYTGTKTATFKIIEDFTAFTISDIPDQTYTGSPIIPEVTVKIGSKTLVKDVDYTVHCFNNTDAGTATMYVSGKGNYADIAKMTFTIAAKPLSGVSVSYVPEQTYTGSAITPDFTVDDGSKTLVKGTDYTVKYSNNVDIGRAKITISGKGNYIGTKTVTFRIVDYPPIPVVELIPDFKWRKISGKWYYMDLFGTVTAGFASIDGAVYYFDDNGVMLTGWQKINGVWYLFASSGEMKTGWVKSGGKWYYMDDEGIMQTGWRKIGGDWYYFASSGAAYTKKWLKSGKKWYYFGSDARMVKSITMRITGKDYTFDSSGAMK